MTDDVYLGNPLLKKANTKIEFTQEQIQEFIKCKNDPVYFARNYIKNPADHDYNNYNPWGRPK